LAEVSRSRAPANVSGYGHTNEIRVRVIMQRGVEEQSTDNRLRVQSYNQSQGKSAEVSRSRAPVNVSGCGHTNKVGVRVNCRGFEEQSTGKRLRVCVDIMRIRVRVNV
jgi:hypothetical protein